MKEDVDLWKKINDENEKFSSKPADVDQFVHDTFLQNNMLRRELRQVTDNYSQLKDAMKNQKTSLVQVMRTQESVKYLTQANGDGNAAPINP